MNLQPRRIEREVDYFSGGNQQKVMLARPLTRPVDVFVFDEPTVGVDVGTRAAIYAFIRDLCEAGAAVVLISSDLPEILHLTKPRLRLLSRPDPRRDRRRGDHRGQYPPSLLRAGGRVMAHSETGVAAPKRDVLYWTRALFLRLGVLPFLLVIAIVVFSLDVGQFSHRRATSTNVVRQSVYLMIVSLGQMFALLTGGFDLSVGTILALTSVVGASAMAGVYSAPARDASALPSRSARSPASRAGVAIGVANGIGVSVFGVSPFIMTLGMSSVGFGIALFLTGGVPVYGMPAEFGEFFGFGNVFGIPVPVCFAAVIVVVVYFFVNRTRQGRYFYAVGGNVKAARLSGIGTRTTLFVTYVLCALLTAIAGMLLTARLDTGEANIGASMPLESIAACVIAGVSLRGGVGRVENVVLGALFIVLVQNGMNLARIESYLQIVVLGALLILAVIADQIRLRYIAGAKD